MSFEERLAQANGEKVYLIYSLEDTDYQKDTKMYFTGTEWGAPGYFNHANGAYPFFTMRMAEKAKEWLDESLVVPRTHYIEEVE